MQNNLLISGLIDWYKWKARIDKVNKEYHNKFVMYDMLVYKQQWFNRSFINFRRVDDPAFLVKIRNFCNDQGSVVCDLPKNYW